MEKKYKLTEETTNMGNRTLYRIEALRDFGDVKKGEKGGYVEKEENLSQSGDCWIYGDAMVYNNALVRDDAKVYCNAYENVLVHDYAEVYGSTKVYEYAVVCDGTKVYGKEKVCG